MSAFRLSERATDDILAVYLQGLEWFGPIQAGRYLEDLEHCFALLAANPRAGREASVAGKGIRRHEHRSHVIFYEEDGSGVTILAVVHARSIRGLRF